MEDFNSSSDEDDVLVSVLEGAYSFLLRLLRRNNKKTVQGGGKWT
jgi:hypothetical protein